MKIFKPSYPRLGLAAFVLAALLIVQSYHARLNLTRPAIASGWALAAVIVFLSLFNVRKKFPMLPLGKAETWLKLHVVGGALALPFFWIHTGTLWPQGYYEQILALLFYLLTASGIAGFILQKIYPGHLTQTEVEIIYERIPSEIFEIRTRAEALILECTQKTGVDTLAQFYLETLNPFFRKPLFFASHAVGRQKAAHWLRHQFGTVKRYLNEAESSYLAKLEALAEMKNKIDIHYALQTVMKGWLLIHVPLTAVLLVFVLWHILLVHAYAL